MANCPYAATGCVFPAFGIVWGKFHQPYSPGNGANNFFHEQPRLLLVSLTLLLMNAVMLVTVTLYGWSSFARCSHDNRLTRPSRSFIISVLAMISIGSQNYLFASAASSLTSKLRSLSFRAILRQDSTLRRESCVLSRSISFFSRIL